jgi:hypothetical protein
MIGLWLKQNWFKLSFLILAIGGFYWYALRPSIIKSKCDRESVAQARQQFKLKTGQIELVKYYPDDYDFYYKRCLRKKGL